MTPAFTTANLGGGHSRRQRLTRPPGAQQLLDVTRGDTQHPAPLDGRRIVITRAEADSRRLADRLAGLGAQAIVLPAIRIEFADPEPLDDALRHLTDYRWVIFTSRTAVEAVFRRTSSLVGPRIAAVGP